MLNSIGKMDLMLGTTEYCRPVKESMSFQKLPMDYGKLPASYEKVGLASTVTATSEKALNEVIKRANKAVSDTNATLEFSTHASPYEIVVKIKDTETGEVIKQIPSEKMLELGDYLKNLSGIIVDEKI